MTLWSRSARSWNWSGTGGNSFRNRRQRRLFRRCGVTNALAAPSAVTDSWHVWNGSWGGSYARANRAPNHGELIEHCQPRIKYGVPRSCRSRPSRPPAIPNLELSIVPPSSRIKYGVPRSDPPIRFRRGRRRGPGGGGLHSFAHGNRWLWNICKQCPKIALDSGQ
jgi:hypothetical protein